MHISINRAIGIMPKSTSHFKVQWLTDERYKDWLKKGKADTEAFCAWCKTTFNVANMGVQALQSHIQSKKHTECKKNIPIGNLFFAGDGFTKRKVPSPDSNAVDDSPNLSDSLVVQQNLSQISLDEITFPGAVTNAEITWCLKTVASHFSFRSCEDIKNVFSWMFPDSKIADQFTLGKTKCAYTINFGLAYYYKNLLQSDILASPFDIGCKGRNGQE